MQGVGGHDHPRQFDPGQCDPGQEGLELGDLAAADRHKSLPGNCSLLVGECGQQMNPSAAGTPDSAAQRLAVHRECRPLHGPDVCLPGIC